MAAGTDPGDQDVLSYDSLPLDPNGPFKNAWGRFGPSDELGMLNLLTPAVVAEAAKEIKTGERISLDLPLDYFRVPFFARPPFKQDLDNKAYHGNPNVNDDILHFNTQSSTQWDGFRHFAPRDDRRFLNGRTQEQLETSPVLGVGEWAQSGGIVGRGVLIDWADWAERHGKTLPAFEAIGIPLAQLQAVVNEQRIAFRRGDILIVRSGFGAAYAALGADARRALAEQPRVRLIGVERSHDMLRWLWERQFAAVAGDAIAFEVEPTLGEGVDPETSLHHRLLSGWGVPIGELFDLEVLARRCRELGRTSFFFSSVPLKVPGGVASPPNAIAIL